MKVSPKEKKELYSRVFNIMQYLNHPTTGETLLTEETVKDVLSKYKTISNGLISFMIGTGKKMAVGSPHIFISCYDP